MSDGNLKLTKPPLWLIVLVTVGGIAFVFAFIIGIVYAVGSEIYYRECSKAYDNLASKMVGNTYQGLSDNQNVVFTVTVNNLWMDSDGLYCSIGIDGNINVSNQNCEITQDSFVEAINVISCPTGRIKTDPIKVPIIYDGKQYFVDAISSEPVLDVANNLHVNYNDHDIPVYVLKIVP